MHNNIETDIDNLFRYYYDDDHLSEEIFNSVEDDLRLIAKEYKIVKKNILSGNYYIFKSIQAGNNDYKYVRLFGKNPGILIDVNKPGIFLCFFIYSESPMYIKQRLSNTFSNIRYDNKSYLIFLSIKNKITL